jgi:hypothetical protein
MDTRGPIFRLREESRPSNSQRRNSLLQKSRKSLRLRTDPNKGNVMTLLSESLIRMHALDNTHTKVRISIFAPSSHSIMDSWLDLEVLLCGRAFTGTVAADKL